MKFQMLLAFALLSVSVVNAGCCSQDESAIESKKVACGCEPVCLCAGECPEFCGGDNCGHDKN